MKKFLYWILVVVFSFITTLARILLFDGSSVWSYFMGMTFMILCDIAYESLMKR
jgi:hypothetical protein